LSTPVGLLYIKDLFGFGVFYLERTEEMGRGGTTGETPETRKPI